MARKVIAEFDAIDGPFINKLNAIDRSVSRFEVGTLNAFGRVEKGMNGLLASASRLQAVSGIIAGGLGANMATGFIDQATRIRRALKEAGDDSQEGFNKAFLAAQRSLSGMEAFSQGVQRMKKATDGTFDASVRNMETLNKLLVLGGKTTQERMSTMIQFSQALQAGVLQGEELRSLRENAPIELVRAIAEEAGGTIQDLKDFGAEGKLTTEVMIRALKRLEAEADSRMKSVTLTISEAATVLANAGIVAVEGFDRGLGLSRATVAGLTGLASVLGENAEVAEWFGKAVQLAGALMLTSFAGRNINAAVNSTRAYSESLRAAATSAAAAEKVAATAVVNAGMRETAIRREVAALRLNDATQRQVSNAYKRLEAAQIATTAAASRYRAAADALTVANTRLSFSARAAAASMSQLRGIGALLGGWPGLILTVGLAFLTLRGNVESAAERFDRLTSGTGEAEAAADRLRDVQSRLNEAIAAAGSASDASAQKIVANTLEELKHKKALLDVETRRAEMTQEERRREIAALRSEIGGIYGAVDDQRGMMQMSGFVDEAGLAVMLSQADAAAAPLRDKIIELEAAMFETGEQIRSNQILLTEASQTAGDFRDGVVGAAEAQVQLTAEAASEHAKLLQQKNDELVMNQLIAQYGEESRVVAEARAFAERLAYEELLRSKEITGPFAEELMAAYDAAAALADTDMASGVAAAGAEAKSLAEWLDAALGRAAALARQAAAAQQQLDQMRFEFSPGGQALNKYGSRGATSGGREISDGRGFVLKEGKFVDPNARSSGGRSSGGGGGRKSENELDREALQFIESMMTAEERRGKQITEMTALRAKLVATYGAEHALVGQVDSALQRLKETQSEASRAFKEIGDDIGDAFAGAVVAGESLRENLANIFRKVARDILSSGISDAIQSVFSGSSSKAKGGGIFGAILGSIFPGRRSGGPVRAGMPYLVNEDTPNSEIYVPSGNGAVLNLSQAQAALRGSQTGGATQLQVTVTMDPSTGALGAFVTDRSRKIVAQSAPAIASAAVQQAIALNREDRVFG